MRRKKSERVKGEEGKGRGVSNYKKKREWMKIESRI